MSDRQRNHRNLKEKMVETLGLQRDIRPIAVWVCLGCWDGKIPMPLEQNGVFRDLGIDLLYDSQPVKRAHKCDGSKYLVTDEKYGKLLLAMFPGGNWKKEVLNLPTTVYEKYLASYSVQAGPPTTEPNL